MLFCLYLTSNRSFFSYMKREEIYRTPKLFRSSSECSISTALRPKRLIDFVRIRSIFFLRHCVIIRRNLGRSCNSRLLVCSFNSVLTQQ